MKTLSSHLSWAGGETRPRQREGPICSGLALAAWAAEAGPPLVSQPELLAFLPSPRTGPRASPFRASSAWTSPSGSYGRQQPREA